MRTLSKNNLEDSEKQKDLKIAKIKRLQDSLRRAEKRANYWKRRYYDYKKSTKLKKVKKHKYPLELIWLGMWMHIGYNISLRGVSQSLSKLGVLYGLGELHISPSTIRNWSLQFGYWSLHQPLEKGHYVMMSDESVEINREKLLLSILVPTAQMSYCQPLCMEDVRILDMGVRKSWKAEDLVKMIEDKRSSQGIIIDYAISDKGTILKKAFKDCQISWVEDCTHKMANIAKSLFCQDDSFNTFIKAMNALRAKWICSEYNLYIPPALRSKARFHQLFTVHKWARFILKNWEQIPKEAQLALHFVQAHAFLIYLLESLTELTETFSRLFKGQGIQAHSQKEWKQYLIDYQSYRVLTKQESQFITQMNLYLEQVQQNLERDTQLLCCSDVIESIFGKYKNKGGNKIITEDVLKIAAYPKKKTMEEVQEAMQSTSIKNIQDWKQQKTIVSKLATLKKMKQNIAA